MIEIESLLEAQWRDGMVPHLRYDPDFLGDYFPGPDWWPAAQGRTRLAGVPTSGITNPPVLPLAALIVGRRQPDRDQRHAFWTRVQGPLTDWLRWFLQRRRPDGISMPLTLHPWETGWDNSPRWDFLARAGLRPERGYERLDRRHVAAAERPTDRDYDSYLRLAEILDQADYDAGAVIESSPFCVHDVVVDALWHAGAVAVDAMAGELGTSPPFDEAELSAYRSAFGAMHWDGARNAYLDWDVNAGAPIAAATAATAVALAGGIAEPELAASAWRRYRELCRGAHLVPTTPPRAPEFDPGRYWRGPVWISVNWLVLKGLEQAGLESDAAEVRSETLGLLSREGFHEYFDARSGEGRGIAGFTWSAALALDLLAGS